MNQQLFNLNSIEANKKLAISIASSLNIGDIVTFTGDLGTGKTTLCKAIIQALCGESIYVTSPTFNLVQLYNANNFSIYHFDLYRLKHPGEIYELAIDDAWKYGVSLIEWPEIIMHILPKDRIDINLAFGNGDSDRVCTIVSNKNFKI